MTGYYKEKLSALRLQQVYEIAPPRVRQYLEAEVNHIIEKTRPGDLVLELGCGYGRILPALAAKAGFVIGIDNSLASLHKGKEWLGDIANIRLAAMDAARPAFPPGIFDVVVCIQNGISAFHVDRRNLIRESITITKPGGKILFSSYSHKFWRDRLEWFYMQADAGLLGEIDEEKTGAGKIVCKDGFTADTVDEEQFRELTAGFAVQTIISEIDESSIFCELTERAAPAAAERSAIPAIKVTPRDE